MQKNKTRHMCDPSLIISTIFSVRENTLKYMKLFI